MRTEVFIPTYNSADTLEAAIRSVREQTRPVDAITVMDDASTDETPQVMARVDGVEYVRCEKNSGACANWQRCVDKASGDFVALLHADDVLRPEWHRLAMEQIEGLDQPREHCVFFGGGEFTPDGRLVAVHSFADQAKTFPVGGLLKLLWEHNFYGLKASANVLYSTAILKQMGGFPYQTYPYMADVPLHLDMLVERPFVYVPEPLVLMQVGVGKRISASRRAELAEGAFTALEERIDAIVRHLGSSRDIVRAEYAFPYWVMWLSRVLLGRNRDLPRTVLEKGCAAFCRAGPCMAVRIVLREARERRRRATLVRRWRPTLEAFLGTYTGGGSM